MSWQRECSFFEAEPNKWFYLIDNSGRNDQWDWREEAECFGPFATEDKAHDHLSDTQSNPGGYHVTAHDRFRTDPVYEAAIKRAQSPAKRRAMGVW